jgi:hypothetical protein
MGVERDCRGLSLVVEGLVERFEVVWEELNASRARLE